MDEEIERLVIGVRADTQGFARDVAQMRDQLEGPLAQGADRAGRVIENALVRAIRTGRLGFDDLKQVALSAMNQIANAAISNGLASLGGGGGGSGGGIASLASSLIGSLMGLPGRATGGPVSPGRAYVVGERGPELFVPTSSGRIETGGGTGRDVRVTIAINSAGNSEPQALVRSGRQVARAVRAALEAAEG